MKNIEDIKKFKIFIAGPMRGYPNYNFDKFDAYSIAYIFRTVRELIKEIRHLIWRKRK